ncbi:MAG: large subunit ribosomal protein L17 [Rhodothermales bacterium]|jgi:large subunit ribosomal protein L17
MAALSNALITHKRITTTLAKAKALRVYVEPLLNRSKSDTTQNRRQVFRHLQDKYTVTELFSEISGKIGERPGGYTRVVKLGQRAGDSAQMAIIELVDYNESGGSGKVETKQKRTRRGRAGSGAKTAAVAAVGAEVAEEVVPEAEAAAEVAEAVADDASDAVAEVADVEASTDAPVDEAAADEAAGDEEKKA